MDVKEPRCCIFCWNIMGRPGTTWLSTNNIFFFFFCKGVKYYYFLVFPYITSSDSCVHFGSITSMVLQHSSSPLAPCCLSPSEAAWLEAEEGDADSPPHGSTALSVAAVSASSAKDQANRTPNPSYPKASRLMRDPGRFASCWGTAGKAKRNPIR